MMEDNGIKIEFYVKAYRSLPYAIIGLIMEPYLRMKNKCNYYTWHLYGFETVICGRKE
jgi:hypothetical protein